MDDDQKMRGEKMGDLKAVIQKVIARRRLYVVLLVGNMFSL
jgi:hypothetical protein